VAGGKKVSKPFKAWVSETVTVDLRSQSEGMDEIGVYFPLTSEFFDAHGTHLGNFAASGTGRYYVFLWETMAPAATVVGSANYVAANGDELHVDFFVEDIEAGIENGLITVFGGTGRFAGASGEFGYVKYTETGEWIPSEEPGADPATEGFYVIRRIGFLAGTVKY
jgi:hypothetical protein